ncbi:methyl-accepting chemotaxis protein [Rhizobacter sp. J219]|uniref:methyl-accepting chemotaxis protein n=1 Tax=Rhizobacter sp. J219 TaxID=2898430 RepID=UPI0021510D8A|nr:PAS domain-containing methyl-accepting chemotaxis protein [Rhizobacter sp. J219]MCR5881998.1 methyl-accepting chemotaxis protein [Rhizobacter sp. J219]
MRHNGPVTQKEHRLDPATRLVSTTDLKGRITYCNPAFVDASGFTREELLGKPHNLIRHPDMPEEAFRDLWATVSQGRPWAALVKNRRKNGDHYWVQANVTPLMEGDTPVGYMSVRSAAPREAVDAADALYRRMREAQASGAPGVRFDAGRVVALSWAGRMGTLWRRVRANGVVFGGMGLALAGFALGTAATSLPTWAGALATAAAGGVATSLAARHVRRPLARLRNAARRMAAGDLRQQIEVGGCGIVGELQAALAQLNVNLQSLVGDARGEVARMQQSIVEIADGNHELSSRTESQASSLQQTAASMEEITGTVRQSAESAQQATALAEAAARVTESSRDAVQRMSGTMKGISESSRRIADISGVIDSIAFQTNLLALNAAVEAARVGEQGRGFGVVAGEVRALAQRTAEAAREIRDLVNAAHGRIDAGVAEAEMAAATIHATTESVTRVTRFMQEISHGAKEQLAGISQVNDAVFHLDGITQHNAALVEQLAASAEALRDRALIVGESVQVFHTGQGVTHATKHRTIAASRRAA